VSRGRAAGLVSRREGCAGGVGSLACLVGTPPLAFVVRLPLSQLGRVAEKPISVLSTPSGEEIAYVVPFVVHLSSGADGGKPDMQAGLAFIQATVLAICFCLVVS